MATGFAALNKQRSSNNKMLLTVKEIVEEGGVNKMIATDEAGTEYKIKPKSRKNASGTEIHTFDEATRPGSILMASSVTKSGAEWDLGFVEWMNRYPGVIKTVKVPAARVSVNVAHDDETGMDKTHAVVTVLDMERKVAVASVADIDAAVDAALASTIVPSQVSGRGLIIAYKNSDGLPMATMLSVGGSRVEKNGAEVFEPNDPGAWAAATKETLKDAYAQEVENGSTGITIVPITRLYGSQNMWQEPRTPTERRFPTVASQYVTETWQSPRNPEKHGVHYGAMESVLSVQPMYDVKAMGKALSAAGGDPSLFKQQTGIGYNSPGMALQLKKLGGNPDAFVQGYFVNAIVSTSYPQPKPLAHTVLGLDFSPERKSERKADVAPAPAAAPAPEDAGVDGMAPVDDAGFDELDNELASYAGGPTP